MLNLNLSCCLGELGFAMSHDGSRPGWRRSSIWGWWSKNRNGCQPKNRGFLPPKWMVYKEKTLWTNGWFGGKHPYFWKHPVCIIPLPSPHHIEIFRTPGTRHPAKTEAGNFKLIYNNQPIICWLVGEFEVPRKECLPYIGRSLVSKPMLLHYLI